MAVYVILTVVAVLLALLVNRREDVKLHMAPITRQSALPRRLSRRQALNIGTAAAVFLLLAGVSACRIAVGNDYWVYRYQFNLIMQGRHVSYEWGFNLVVWLIQSLFGYDNYIPVFAVFSIATAYFFVRAMYEQSHWFAASVFLLMTGGFYFSSLNSVRYYFVLAVALYAMKYAVRRQYGKFILWILFAACFHKSILVVIPIYIGARWLADRKINKYLYIAGGLLLASLIVFRDFYREIIFFFYPYYEGSAFDKVDFSYTNIAKCVGVLALSVLFYKTAVKENVQNRFYFFLNLAGLAVYTCGSFIPEVSRIGYYLIASQIFLIPGILVKIKNRKWKLIFTAGAGIAFTGYFALFLHSAYDTSIRLLPYLNWIFN